MRVWNSVYRMLPLLKEIQVTVHIKCIIQKLARVVASRRGVSSNNGIVNILTQQGKQLVHTAMKVPSTMVLNCLPVQASRWSLEALLLNDGPDHFSFEYFLFLTPYQRLN